MNKKIAISFVFLASTVLCIFVFLLIVSMTGKSNAVSAEISNDQQLRRDNRILTDSTWQIGTSHAGKILLSMDIELLSGFFGKEKIKPVEVKSEGETTILYNITVGNEKTDYLEVEPMCMDICVVSRIWIYCSKYRTSKGIGVSSTYYDIKKTYAVKSVIGGEDLGIYIYTDEFPQIAFVVRPKGVSVNPGKKFSITDIPDEAVVETIYMY